MYENMMPKNLKKGKRGFYPVTTAEEWEELPAVYKAMEWFPVEVYNLSYKRKERTVAEYIEFEVPYMEPYGIRATVKVHVQEVQKILFCYHEDASCFLHSICGVVFANGERWGAKWEQDRKTGAYAVYASGKLIGKQGGYLGYIPTNIEKTEDGFKWAGFKNESETRTHYALLNPFSKK